MCQLYRFWLSLSKSKRPSNKSYLTVQDATIEPLILDKLHFFVHVCGILKPFLTLYQCVKPMMQFLYDDLYVLLREMASKFVLHTSQRMIYGHLMSNNILPQLMLISKELRKSVRSARTQQRLDNEANEKEEVEISKKRKAESLMKDIYEIKSKKIILEKVVIDLKTDYEKLILKAAGDAKKAFTYAIEAKGVMKKKDTIITEIDVLDDTMKSLEKKHKEL